MVAVESNEIHRVVDARRDHGLLWPNGAVRAARENQRAPLGAPKKAMTRFLWICFGSAAGGGARYLLSGWMMKVLGTAFPYGTLAVNVLGSFLLAALMVVGIESTMMSSTVRLALTVGVMGGFTTYSTFSYETMKYLQDGAWGIAVGNVLVTVVACLVGCGLGWAGTKWLIGA